MTDTLLLRALATLLIINSHSEPFYPFRQLAFGGLVGDSLFFFLSGFGLALGQAKSRRGFLDWYGRRASRIYPAVILVVLLFDVFLARTTGGSGSWRSLLAALAGFGGNDGFVGQIMTMYVLIYGILKLEARAIAAILALLCLPYALIPLVGRGDAVFHGFHWAYYFHQMVFGVWLARRAGTIRGAGPRTVAALAIVALVLASTRAVLATGRFADWFFVPHLIAFPLIYLLLRTARGTASTALLERHPGIARGVALLGGASLETYLIHTRLIPRLAIAGLPFPIGLATFVAVSVVLGCLLAAAMVRVRGLLTRRVSTAPSRERAVAALAEAPAR